MNWTEDQQKAINSVGNTIVTAAAGSGKTAVLVERVIKKLSDENNPVSADRLLIVTLTNAAAAEMRRRIEKALSDKCAEQPENTYLLNQRLLISSADICTIDSFCIRLVRNNFSNLGISPDFKIADEVTDSSIKQSVCKKIFKEYFEKNDSEFLIYAEDTNLELVQKSLYIEPALEYVIKEESDNVYKLKFKQNIPDNTIVKLQYVKNKITEDSWAYQTSNKLSVSSTYPATRNSNK